MRKMLAGAGGIVLVVFSGCVVVNPKGDVRMSPLPDFGKKNSSRTPYAAQLETVMKQQQKVTKKLQKQDWEGLVRDTNSWTEEVRELSGYAHTTYDPARFKTYCDQLLVSTQGIRDAALHQDPGAANTALNNCDPSLDHLSREFPTDARLAAVAASPQQPAYPAPPAPSQRPRPTP